MCDKKVVSSAKVKMGENWPTQGYRPHYVITNAILGCEEGVRCLMHWVAISLDNMNNGF